MVGIDLFGGIARGGFLAISNKRQVIVRSRGKIQSKAGISFVALCAFLLTGSQLLAQDAALKVAVDGATYVVTGTAVSGPSEPVDAAIAEKARFTARVLRQQILDSQFAKQVFAPQYRAVVFSDSASGRLNERWRRSLRNESPEALARAQDQFKQWASKLASDPNELMLAVAKQDYLDGIGAYRESARIYRGVTKGEQPLTYDDALRLMRNAWPVIRLAYARGLEEQLVGNAAPTNSNARPADADRFSQRMQTEVVNRVGSDIKEAADLDRLSTNVRKIVEADSAAVRAYRDAIKPPQARFAAFEPRIGSARLPAVNPAVIKITIPQPAAKAPALVDITGGILPPPYPLTRPAPASGNTTPTSTAQSPSATPPGANNTAAPAQGSTANPASPNDTASNTPTNSPTASPSTSEPSSAPNSSDSDINNVDNLKTFSSRGYHRGDGWVFNPATGLWQDPNDPSQSDNPTVLTCCDETGLAFPSDAIEAQQDYAWNEAGIDPNCGRLYTCDPSGVPTPGPDKGTTADPTDKDDEIIKAYEFIDRYVPPEEKSYAYWKVMTRFPRAYYSEAIKLYRRFKTDHPFYPRHASTAAGPVSRTYSGTRFGGSSPTNQSTITGIAGMSSHYDPITKVAAQNVAGKYGTVPGGVVLEGGSGDLSFVKTAVFVPKANAFIINDDIVYVNPVSASHFGEIVKAIAVDDKIGVSLGIGTAEVFGGLPSNSAVAANLELADRFLGQIGFGQNGHREPTSGYIWTDTHESSPLIRSGSLHVFFAFRDFRFHEDDSGELRRVNMQMSSTVIPVAAKDGPDKKRLPDYGRIERKDFPPEVVANLKDLQDNFVYYARERIIRMTIGYGEVAAFARSLKAQGVKLEIR